MQTSPSRGTKLKN